MPRIRIAVEDAHAMWREEGATILDVVDTHMYRETTDQLRGAVRIDPEDVPARFHELPKGKPVLAY